MFDYLPKSIRAVHDRCWSAETPGGLLRCLPHLFKAVQKDKETASQIAHLDEQLESSLKNELRNRESAVEWMQLCFSHLKSSPFASHSFSAPFLEAAEELLIHRRIDSQNVVVSSEFTGKVFGDSLYLYNPLDRSWGFIDAALNALYHAANAIASFGADPLFEGWAKVKTERIHPHELESQFPENTSGEVKLKIDEQCELAEKMGHGVYCWEVRPPRKSSEYDIQKTAYLRKGYLEDLIYPKQIQKLFPFQNKTGQKVWSELCDSDPVIFYKFLKLLAQYDTYEPATLPPKQMIESWEDVECFSIQADVGFYLSRFGSKNPLEHPLTLQQLQKLVDRFLTFLLYEKPEGIKRGPRDVKEIARKITRKAVEKKWNKLMEEGKDPRTYDDFTPTISEFNHYGLKVHRLVNRLKVTPPLLSNADESTLVFFCSQTR